jgi:hypothetical protein
MAVELYGGIALLVGAWLVATAPVRRGYLDAQGRWQLPPSRRGQVGRLVFMAGLGIIVYGLIVRWA